MRYDVPALSEPLPHPGGPTVRLRAHTEDDVGGVLEQCNDAVSQAWTTVPVPYSLDLAKRFVRDAMPGGWATDQEWAFAVEVEGRFAGTVSLRNEGAGRAEIAYGSHPWVRGTGAMERALRLLLAWGFAEAPDGRGLHTVIWWANRGNITSRKLAWRLGFDIAPGLVRGWLEQRGELLDAWVGTLLSTDRREPRHRWIDAPVIESPRSPMRLRATRESDVPRVIEACQDPETAYWLGGLPQPYTQESAADFVVRRAEGGAAGTAAHFVVAARDDDRALGVLTLVLDQPHRAAEVGYWTHPAERGRGVMTEAVRLAVRHALLPEEDGGLGLVKVWAVVAEGNRASRAVLTRAGLPEVGRVRLGTLTGDGLVDGVRHELLATELA